jgi:tetratricopeptide (TPR) repeat protein
MAITAFGDLREACLASIGAGMSSAMLGDRYEADRLLNLAEQYARHLGDEQLIEAAQGNQAYANSRFAGQPATSPQRSQDFHMDLIENAKKGSGNPGEIEDILEYVGYQNYEFALRRLDELEQRCEHPDVLAFVYFIKSNIFVRMGDWAKDVEMLEAFGRIRPDEPMAEQNFGVAYSSLGDYERAERHYLRAIELMDGQYPLAVCNLGVLYTNMGRLDDARTQLERAEAQGAPENPLETLRGKIMRLERSNGV